MSLVYWSWLFLVVYIGAMLSFGIVAQRRVRHADDFATARGSYGPFFLALAFAASIASGATFLGSTGLAYEYGLATMWGGLLYPLGAYFGVLISMRLIATSGNRFGNRSIPEYLGDRYQSDGIRVLVALFSLVLFFYLAGQLVSGLVMFETMLGLPPLMALAITTLVLFFYVALGGAHADILTDGCQGLLMLLVAIFVMALFFFGYGMEGGFWGIMAELERQNSHLVRPLNVQSPLYSSWWCIIALFFAHIPLGLLPHIGNKLWALRDTGGQVRFIKFATIFGLTLGLLSVGGLHARALFGDQLFAAGSTPNEALPRLFIALFPNWLAALIGIGILSAIMSTADGLVVSSSQIVANDLYRRTFVPRFQRQLSDAEVDARVLIISRLSAGVTLLICTLMAWFLLQRNIALIVWLGIGGMMGAFAGPLVVGGLWRGVTKAGAYAGLASGFFAFAILHIALQGSWFDPAYFDGTRWYQAAVWLKWHAANPFSCAAISELISILATCLVSAVTKPLPADHLRDFFTAPSREDPSREETGRGEEGTFGGDEGLVTR